MNRRGLFKGIAAAGVVAAVGTGTPTPATEITYIGTFKGHSGVVNSFAPVAYSGRIPVQYNGETKYLPVYS